jgi:hypothetical protein
MQLLSINNGPILFAWDGLHINDLLKAIELIDDSIRDKLQLTDLTDDYLLDRLSLFEVKAVDASGLCLRGSNWDEIIPLRLVLDLPNPNAKFIDRVFVECNDYDNPLCFVIVINDHIGKVVRLSSQVWEWSVINSTGGILIEGESKQMLTSFKECHMRLKNLYQKV